MKEQGLSDTFPRDLDMMSAGSKKQLKNALLNSVTNKKFVKLIYQTLSWPYNIKFTDEEHYSIYKRTGLYLEEISADYILKSGTNADYEKYLAIAPAKFYMVAAQDKDILLYTLDYFEKISQAPSICAWTDLVMQDRILLEELLSRPMPKSLIRNDRYTSAEAWQNWMASDTWPYVLLFTCEPCVLCVNLLIKLGYNQVSNYTWVVEGYPIPDWII